MKQTRLGKRVAAWLLCLAMVLTAINLPSFTVTAYANEEYDFDDKDVLLFSGEGELTRDEVQTQAYKDENIGKKIARIEGYSSIGAGAFGGQKFEIVIIGDSVNDIYEEAFASIINCKYIVLPNSLTCIQGTTAFWGARCIVYSGYLDDPNNWGAPKRCDKIVDGFCLSSDGRLLSGYVGDSTSITIPSGVDSIDDGAFAKSYLQEIVIPAHELLVLGDGLFEECNTLACVKFEDISNLVWKTNPFTNTPNYVYFDIEKTDEVSKIKDLYDLIVSDDYHRVRVHPMYYDEVSETCIVEKLPLPEPLPEKLFKYDADSDMFVLTVNDENKDVIAEYEDIRILANHKLIIDTDLVIAGDLVVDSLGAITINKGCSISAFYVDLSDIVSVKLGDKDCLEGLGIAAGDFRTKHTGNPVFDDFDPEDIDDTEFMKENGLLVYKDGPDCGINMNSDGTCVSEDGETEYGDVYFEVYTNPDDAVPAYTGLLEEDFAAVDLDPTKFKAGSRIDFVVKSFGGKVLQTNGVRFLDNKNYISTQEEEAKADTSDGCKCSYILTEDPDRYLTVSVQFVRPDELLTDATFAWSYDEMAQQYVKDTYVSHGVIEVVSAYNDGEPLFNSHRPDISPYWSEPGENVKVSDEEGNKWFEKQGRFPIGTELIVRLIPDRGYQLTKFTISNIESSTTAVDGVNEYTFNLSRPDHYHLCAVFTPVEDKVDILTASGITAGSVTFDDTEVDSGTMVLNVSDATPDAEEKSAFETMADNKGYEVAKYINLESEQRFYKAVENATREQCWIVEKSELDFPANITLDISGLESEDVIVLHNHNGSYEEITATYENGQLSFSSQSLSNFAIAVKKTTHTCDSHSGTKVAQVDATCITDGVKAYYECSCGKHFTDSECTQEITDLDAWKVSDGKITQRNHDFSEEIVNDSTKKSDATCTEKAKYYKSCICGAVSTSDEDVFEVGTALGHSFSKGAVQTKCDRCDFTREATKEVENLTVTSGVGEAVLTWSAVPGAVKYAVYMKTSAGTTLLNSNVTTNSYKATGLAGGEKIGFTVRPYIDSWGSYSPVVWAMVHTPQTAVVSKVVVATDMNQATVSWSAVSGAREYALYQKNADGTTVLVSNGLTGTTYTVTGLADGARVGYSVRAKLGSTWYGYSTVTWVTLPAPAVPPTGVKAQGGDGCATVTWNEVPGAGRYALYQKSASGAVTLISAEVTGTSYEVTGLTNGETVGFVLKSRTSKGWSTWSATGWTKPQGGR